MDEHQQPPSQVTVYRDEDNYNTLNHKGTSGPPTSHHMPINAMYSHMSIQRGTGSLETTSRVDHIITDPKLGDGTTFLVTPNNNDGNVQYTQSRESYIENANNQMKVVTKIRSKMSNEFRSSDDIVDETKQTMDFNDQVDLKQLLS